MKSYLAALLILTLLLAGCGDLLITTASKTTISETDYDETILLPTDRYPETMAHIASAIKAGASAICTIDRNGAESNREASLNGIPIKKGFDRDEWPMAMCQEGGEGADIAYVSPKDNRGAGSWIGNQLTDLKDGTRVMFVIDGEPEQTAAEEEKVYYANCKAAKDAGASPLHKGDPGYNEKLDRDKDGVACS